MKQILLRVAGVRAEMGADKPPQPRFFFLEFG